MRPFVLLLALSLPAACGAAPSSAANEALTPAPAPVDESWRRDLVVERSYTATVDGRRLAVYVGKLEFGRVHYRGMGIDADEGPFYELRDAATDAVLRPLSWDEVHVVPGRGVFVLPADERFARLKKSHDNQVEFVYRMRTAPESMGEWPRFRAFDVATGALAASDVLVVDEQFADRREDTSLPEALREPSSLVIRWNAAHARCDAEIVAPSGDSLGVYPDYAAPGPGLGTNWATYVAYRDRWLLGAGRFGVIHTRRANGERQAFLLGRLRELIEPLLGDVCEFEHAQGTMLGMRVAESVPSEDLWAMLQPNGTFAVPAGTLGFRPYDCLAPDEVALRVAHGTRREVFGWIVRSYLPLTGDRQPWGYTSPDLAQRWNQAWRDYAIEANEHLDPMSRVLYVERDGHGWFSYVLPRRTMEQRGEVAAAATLEECQAATRGAIARDAARYEAWVAKRDAEDARRRAADRLQRDWAEAVRVKDDAEMAKLVVMMPDPDAWYTFAMHARSQSPELFERAAGKVKSAAHATELRELAKQRRAELEKEKEAARLAALEAVQAPVTESASDFTRGAVEIRPTLSPMLENPGLFAYPSQAYGGWQVMPWDR